jgi:hypothetical protein
MIGAILAGSAAAGVVSSLLAKHANAPDLSGVFKEIDASGANQRELINALPAELKKQYDAYTASNAAAGTALQTGMSSVGEKLKAETAALYGPDAPAVRAAMDASKTAIYADLPGQQAAIRQALAATGGFDRGTAGKQLAAPVLQAGQQYGQQIANITAQQLAAKQNATKNAIDTVARMDENTLTQLFGMSRDQATAILNGNRQDLKDQMTDLVNQSTQQTNQKLGAMGANLSNQYQQKVAEAAQSNAQTNAWIGLGSNLLGGWKGITQGLGATDYNNPANRNDAVGGTINPY